jgi:hypothetical protein
MRFSLLGSCRLAVLLLTAAAAFTACGCGCSAYNLNGGGGHHSSWKDFKLSRTFDMAVTQRDPIRMPSQTPMVPYKVRSFICRWR